MRVALQQPTGAKVSPVLERQSHSDANEKMLGILTGMANIG